MHARRVQVRHRAVAGAVVGVEDARLDDEVSVGAGLAEVHLERISTALPLVVVGVILARQAVRTSIARAWPH